MNNFSKNGQKPIEKPKSEDQESEDEDDKKEEEVKVARPTTKPTDRGRKFAPEKYKYTFMTDTDRNKSGTFM